MKHLILSWLLHHANRTARDTFAWMDNDLQSFYAIKSSILSKHGEPIRFDVQHIEGKKCWTCDGSGNYPLYNWSSRSRKPYDWVDCNHCNGGWYKLPQWILLSVLKFGPYTFHKPIHRKYCAKNPFAKLDGCKDAPLISGYIDHDYSAFGEVALLILFMRYRPANIAVRGYLVKIIFKELRWSWIRLKKRFHWSRLLIAKPELKTHFLDENGNIDDYPF